MAGPSGNPTLLTIDIAFDWDSKSKAGFDGFCLCGPSGFDMQAAGNPPSGITVPRRGDQLQFAVYDISHPPAERTRTVSDLKIEMRSAHDATTAGYPFADDVMGGKDGDWYPIKDLSVKPRDGKGGSGVFGGDYPVWTVQAGSLTKLDLVTAGWFFFRVSLKATQDSKHKTFGNDPEFIIGPDT